MSNNGYPIQGVSDVKQLILLRQKTGNLKNKNRLIIRNLKVLRII